MYQIIRENKLILDPRNKMLIVSIKGPGLDIWKKSLSNNQYYLFFQILEAYNNQFL